MTVYKALTEAHVALMEVLNTSATDMSVGEAGIVAREVTKAARLIDHVLDAIEPAETIVEGA